MIKSITEVAEEEQFYTKTMANNIIKITSTTPNTEILSNTSRRKNYIFTPIS
jgi:hypothetical protein